MADPSLVLVRAGIFVQVESFEFLMSPEDNRYTSDEEIALRTLAYKLSSIFCYSTLGPRR